MMSSRGFALPMVVLLIAIVSVGIVVILERQTAQSLGTARQLDEYRSYHAGRGVEEAVIGWISNVGASSLPDMLDEHGRAFELQVDKGQKVEVFLFEGQGKALAEFSGLSAESATLGTEIVNRLGHEAGARARDMLRRDGPLAISVNSAPQEVLAAAIDAVTAGGVKGSLVSDLMRARGEGPLDAARLQDVVRNSQVSPEQQGQILQVLTATPVLWRVVAQAVSPDGQVVRFEGLAVLNRLGTISANDRASAAQHPSAMISWERVE